MLLPLKRKKRGHRTWQISTRPQTLSTSPQSNLPRYVMAYLNLRFPDVVSRPLAGTTRGDQVHLMGCFDYDCTLAVLVAVLLTRVTTAYSCKSRQFAIGTGSDTRSPPSFRSPRCYHDQVFTRHPLSPEEVYRDKTRVYVRLSSRSLVERRQPRTRPLPDAETIPRE